MRKMRFSITRSPITRFVWLVGLTAIALMLGNTAWQVWSDYDRTVVDARNDRGSLARIADAQLSARLQVVDRLLQDIIQERLRLGRPDHPELLANLKFNRAFLPGVRELFIVDETGHIRAISRRELTGADVSGREYFQVHRAGDAGLYLSPPFFGITKEQINMASRAIRDGRGRFLGIAAASLAPQFLIDALGAIPPEHDGLVILFGNDRIIRMGLPDQETFNGKSLKGGPGVDLYLASGKRMTDHRIITVLTGQDRFSTFRRLEFPGNLHVIVSQNAKAVLAEWRHQSLLKGVIALASSGLIFFLILASRRALRRRTQVEEELQNSEERFRIFYDLGLVGLAIASPEKRWMQVNDCICSMLGFRADELLKMTWEEVTHPDDLPVDIEQFQRVLNGELEGYEKDKRFITKTGQIVFTRLVVRCVRKPDRSVNYLVAMIEDITERKKAEELIKNILESIDEGFIIIDRDFRILTANRAFADQVKMSMGEVIGRHCYEVSHHSVKPCDESGFECGVRRVFETGAPQAVVHTHYDAEGNPVQIEAKAYPLSKDESGNVATVIEILINVTEKYKLESQLRHSLKMEAVGQLAGGVAHDFNNILSAIIGYGHITLMKMGKDDPLRLNIEHILEAADRAAHLTQSLLVFSRKQISTRKPADFNDIIRRVEKFLLRVIGEDIELKTIMHEGTIPILGDSHQLEQVLMNLATNARDAMPNGGSFTIATELIVLDKEFITFHGYGTPGLYALLTVSDTGIGMDEETRQKIFDPFFTTKEVGKGTGLGLSVIYGIIKQHDGYINVYSEPGKGTTFRIYVPVTAEGVKDEERTTEAEYLQKGTETVLLAEDNALLRNISKIMLEQFGYKVIEAIDGEDAVAKFMENKDTIDLLLFDLIMPKKNGKEACDEIRKMAPDTKVIFVSGYSPDLVQQRVSHDKELSVVYKPISPADLLKKVRAVLDEEKT